jgi:Fe2+ transport system protein B
MVDGFICVLDVSLVQQRPLERQIDYTAHIITNLLKTKKPIVLITTKNDEAQENYVREVEKLLTRKEFRNCTIPIVETSAHENVNIELAFLTLAQLIDKASGKARLKLTGYPEAARIQKELRDVAREAYLNLIRLHVTDHKALWTSVLCKIRQNDNYIHFQDLCGTDQARRLFQRHMIQLKEQYLHRRRDQYLEQLGNVLRELLPDLYTIADR